MIYNLTQAETSRQLSIARHNWSLVYAWAPSYPRGMALNYFQDFIQRYLREMAGLPPVGRPIKGDFCFDLAVDLGLIIHSTQVASNSTYNADVNCFTFLQPPSKYIDYAYISDWFIDQGLALVEPYERPGCNSDLQLIYPEPAVKYLTTLIPRHKARLSQTERAEFNTLRATLRASLPQR